MSYKIAIASSDGKQIDMSFGSAPRFFIYEAAHGGCEMIEERSAILEENDKMTDGHKSGCGCQNETGGCGGTGAASAKAELLADCRCVVCAKIGPPMQKQLERREVTPFAVSCSVEEALDKILFYFSHMDHHESLSRQI